MTRILVTTALLGLAVGTGAASALAQPGNPLPGALAAQVTHLEVTLEQDASGALAAHPGKGFNGLPAANPIVLRVICTASVDCSKVAAKTSVDGKEADNWFGVGKTQQEAAFRAAHVTLVGNTPVLILRMEGGKSVSVSIPDPLPDSVPPVEALKALSPLTGTVLEPCGADTTLMRVARDSGQAAFMVTPTGNVLYRTRPEVDETEPVVVYVRGPRRIVERIVVRRTSEFRQLGGFPLVGEDATVPRSLLRESTGGAGECGIARALVENFAGDKAAQIELSTAVESNDGSVERKVTGNFDFAVNRMYRGALSLGVLRTDLEDPSFRVEGNDSLIVKRDGGRRYLYALMFTPYAWGRRNAEHWSPSKIYQYLNPTVGVVVNDIDGNALGGATLELPGGIFLTAGYHMGRVTQLPEGGPGVGSRAPADSSLISEEHWDSDWFYSVTVDLRAAAKLLTRLTGS